jgi:hypothetical protein
VNKGKRVIFRHQGHCFGASCAFPWASFKGGQTAIAASTTIAAATTTITAADAAASFIIAAHQRVGAAKRVA